MRILYMNDTLSQQVAQKVIQTFNSIKKGKPTTRSNGIKEWTVMASVVMISNGAINPITIATGVKALPDKVRAYSKGLMVHDLHAEVLALRAFNRYLLDEVAKGDSKILSKQDEKFSLNSEIQLALVITEAPCGDASMGYIAQNSTPWSSDGPNKRQKLGRGRNNFDRLGIVRTKPGRADSIPTLSKSCSDKLCMKQLTGINNCMTSEMINPIYLDYLMVPDGKYKQEDMKRSFDDRFDIAEATKFKVLSYELKGYDYEKHEGMEPSPLSVVYIDGNTHVIHNGVKNGGFVKNKPPKTGNESPICNLKMYEKLNSLYPQNIDYMEFKKNQDRELVKKKGRLVLGEWKETSDDNFSCK